MGDTHTTANKDPDIIVPINTDNKTITDGGNLAYLAGALSETKEFYVRSGHFENLIKYRAVLFGNKTVVDSAESVWFASGIVPDGGPYDIENPCPPTAARVTAYDVGKTVNVDDFLTVIANAPKPDGFYMNQLAVKKEDRAFSLSLASIVGNKREREALLKAADYSGLALLPLIKTKADNVTDGEKTLASTEFTLFAAKPFVGELTLDTFDKWYEKYDQLVKRIAPASRPGALETIGKLDSIFFREEDTRKMYELTLKVDKPAPGDLEARLKCIRDLLNSRLTGQRIEEAYSNQGQPHGSNAPGGGHQVAALATTLAKEGYTADQITAIIASVKADPIKDLRTPPPGGWVKAPRDAQGKVSHWIVGMESCPCGVGGGSHLRRDRNAGCTLPEAGAKGGGKGGGRGNGGGRGRGNGRSGSGRDGSQNGSRENAQQESNVSNFLASADSEPCSNAVTGVDAAVRAQLQSFFGGS